MGYNEIVAKGILIDYTEDVFRIETWQLPDKIVECIWLPQNEGMFPTTISYKRYDENYWKRRN